MIENLKLTKKGRKLIKGKDLENIIIKGFVTLRLYSLSNLYQLQL